MATLSQDAYKRLIAQGANPEQLASVAQQKGITIQQPTAQPKVTSTIDMNVGENTGNLGPEAQALYGFGERKAPTVATPSQPVVQTTYTNQLSYDPNNPLEYIRRAQIKGGDKLSADEKYNLFLASDALKAQQQQAANPYQSDLDRLTAEQEAQRQAEAGRDTAELEAYKKQLEAQYGLQRSELLASGERQKGAAQGVYSFSGFGRSTAAADKMVEIQKGTDSAINNLNAAMQAEIARKKAELEGADSETLEALNDRVQQYRNAATQRQVDAIAKTEEANRAGSASYEEAVNNLVKAASDSGINLGDAKNIGEMAQLARNADGSVNEAFIATLPPDLQALIRSAAETSGASEAPEVKNFGTAKSPDYRQWNGKERVRVAGGARGGAGGGGGSGGTANLTQQQNDILTAIKELKQASGLEGAVGVSLQKVLPGFLKPGEGEFIPGTKAANFEAKFNRLRNMMVLPNLSKLKGTISDKDIEFLKSASSDLSLDMSEAEFKRTLDKLEESITGTSSPYGKQEQTASGVDEALSLME